MLRHAPTDRAVCGSSLGSAQELPRVLLPAWRTPIRAIAAPLLVTCRESHSPHRSFRQFDCLSLFVGGGDIFVCSNALLRSPRSARSRLSFEASICSSEATHPDPKAKADRNQSYHQRECQAPAQPKRNPYPIRHDCKERAPKSPAKISRRITRVAQTNIADATRPTQTNTTKLVRLLKSATYRLVWREPPVGSTYWLRTEAAESR